MKTYAEMTPANSPWLGEMPAHWELSRFRYEAVINGGQVDPREEPWSEMILIAPNHIESNTGRIISVETAKEQGADSGKYLVEPGQLVYSKIRPALNKAAIADTQALCSADMYAISFADRVEPRFALYYFLARPFHTFATIISTRVKMPKVNREELADAPWLVPPLGEQHAIADYLDRETARIDTLIEEQQHLVEMLRERRVATIAEALDGYEMARLRRLVDRERPMTYGILQCGPLVDGGVVYVGPSDIVGEGRSPERAALRTTAPEIAAAYQRSVLAGGDVVVSIGPAYGKVAVVSDDLAGGNLTQDTVRVALRHDLVDTRFVVWALLSRQTTDYWDREIMGATFRRLNLGTLAKTPIPLPGMDDQRRIAEHLDEQTVKIDTLIAETEKFIVLARERRAALITAAVTGQIDVREMA
jgi:type I restriction enzyme, S subunit